ncbi:MAG: dTMP kinase [Planctomycetes bacterium]|nr:dTMP kinase [Planctomycetota bacterium]
MSTPTLERIRGKFLVFDGVDGAGKGSQLQLLGEALTAAGIPWVQAKDPGGTEIGDRIRHVLLDYDLSKMDVRCEALLFMASRAQLVHDVIDPALASGKTVLCDRFVSATCAYQGAAGYDPTRVIELARFAINTTWPHLTLIFDVAAEEGLERTGRRPKSKKKNGDVHGQVRLFHDTHPDAMEHRPLDFHQKVRNMFLDLPAIYPAPIAIINGAGDVDDVRKKMMEAIDRAAL